MLGLVERMANSELILEKEGTNMGLNVEILDM